MKNIPYFLLSVCLVMFTCIQTKEEKYRCCYLLTQKRQRDIRRKKESIDKKYDSIHCLANNAIKPIDAEKSLIKKIKKIQKNWQDTQERSCEYYQAKEELARQKHQCCMMRHCDERIKTIKSQARKGEISKESGKKQTDEILYECKQRIQRLELKVKEKAQPLVDEKSKHQKELNTHFAALYNRLKENKETLKDVLKVSKEVQKQEKELHKLQPCQPAYDNMKQPRWEKLFAPYVLKQEKRKK